jgi:hypothetical protein
MDLLLILYGHHWPRGTFHEAVSNSLLQKLLCCQRLELLELLQLLLIVRFLIGKDHGLVIIISFVIRHLGQQNLIDVETDDGIIHLGARLYRAVFQLC